MRYLNRKDATQNPWNRTFCGVTLSIAMTLLCVRVQATLLDPVGDTFGMDALQMDITSVDAIYDAGTLRFIVTCAGSISPASAGLSNSIKGFVDLDTDRNSLTGEASFVSTYGPSPAPDLGDEFYVDLFTESIHPGEVDVFDAVTGTVVGTIPVDFGSNSLSLIIPLSLLGGDDGLVNYAVIAGTLTEATDEAPDGMIPGTSHVPVPGDLDRDGEVDRTDVDLFLGCVSGPAILLESGCEKADFDSDDDVDQEDFGILQRCYGGEGVHPDPICAN
jgi:hypothetical protein